MAGDQQSNSQVMMMTVMVRDISDDDALMIKRGIEGVVKGMAGARVEMRLMPNMPMPQPPGAPVGG